MIWVCFPWEKKKGVILKQDRALKGTINTDNAPSMPIDHYNSAVAEFSAVPGESGKTSL